MDILRDAISAASYHAQLTHLVIIEKMMAGRKDIEAGRIVSNDLVLAELQEKIKATSHSLDGATRRR